MQPQATQRDTGLPSATRRIIMWDESPLRVIAGPGTGKTYAMVRRVARLLAAEIPPERLLVCTFTRTAADDIRRALRRDLQMSGANDVQAVTLHSLCMRLLFQSAVFDITGRTPRTLHEFEETFLLEDLQGEGFGGKRDKEKRLQAFNAAWARLQSDEAGWPMDPIDKDFNRKLMDWLRFHRAMLIGELVPQALTYLRENPTAPERRQFDHVLIDEYQDLNRAEQVLLDYLSESGDVTVIGDEDQSIYSFKYAYPEGIATFAESHPHTHDEGLEECRRCPHLIVEMANHLIENNLARESRVLRVLPENPAGEVHAVQWVDIAQEAQGLAQFLRRRIDSHTVEAGNILVLAPRRPIGYAIRNALNAIGVSAHSFFREELLEGTPRQKALCSAQEAFTLLTLLASPEDAVALRCWCGFGSATLRSTAWSKLRAYCDELSQPPLAVLELVATGGITLPGISNLIPRYVCLKERLAAISDLRGVALVSALFPDGDANTGGLRSAALALEAEDYVADDLLEWLTATILRQGAPVHADYVRVMSLHKAKGLTADLVVVAGCVEGLLPRHHPGLPQLEAQQKLEEQRRLFYVAITRTKQTLILSSYAHLPYHDACVMGVPIYGRDRQSVRVTASSFLNELGPYKPKPVLGSTWLAEQHLSQ